MKWSDLFGVGRKKMREEEEVSELPEGMRLEVRCEEKSWQFTAELEWVHGELYQFHRADGAEMPVADLGLSVTLRGRDGDELLFVEGVIVDCTEEMWRVEQSRTVRGKDKRAYFRQNLDLEVLLCCANDLRGEECGEKTPQGKYFTGTLMNLSAGGTQIRTAADFAETDWIGIAELSLVEEMEPFSFVCAIRRKSPVKDGKHEFIYGCQFLDMGAAEQDRLIHAILMLQRKEIRRGRGTRGN